MHHRVQHTIAKAVETRGVGFLTGADVTLRFLPAPPNFGIAFQRTDLAGSTRIPALVEYVVPRQRRTAIAHAGVAVEMIEHVMAALAGLRIDNCLVQLDAPEPPGCDGSSRRFAECLVGAGIVEQDAPRRLLVIQNEARIHSPNHDSELVATALPRRTLAITYQLDYGTRSPIRPQLLTVEITPETFLKGLSYARTFVLEAEANALRAQGLGRRTTEKDLLIFGPDGVIGNELRSPDECVRHKILDCLGDFALIGCDVYGHFRAFRSGHQLNHEIIRRVKEAHTDEFPSSTRAAA